MHKQSLRAEHFSPDTLDFLRCLEAQAVRFLVVGGEAVILHGYPRLTGDVDFFYDRAPDNAEKLFAALLNFWSGDIPGITNHLELMELGVIIQFGRPPNRIDLMNSIDGIEFDEAWAGRLMVEIVGAVPSP